MEFSRAMRTLYDTGEMASLYWISLYTPTWGLRYYMYSYAIICFKSLHFSLEDGMQDVNGLTHWGRVTHICVGKLILGSDNGLSSGRLQAII